MNTSTTLKMRVLDWWNEDNKENFYNNGLIQLLSQKYEIIYSDKPDFIIYGPFGFKHLEYDCVRIFVTGENLRTDWNIADYGIDFDFLDFGERHLRVPLEFMGLPRQWQIDGLKRVAQPTQNKKFCGIMVSNAGFFKETRFREIFFEELSRYKKVDSGGAWKNNIGGILGSNTGSFRPSKIEWLRGYKFNICFENSSYPGYLTEKLFDAYYAGSIPIYWGDTSLKCNLQGRENLQALQDNNGGGGSIA